jgi:hypothetical protein
MSADFAAETLEVAHAVRMYEIEHKQHKPISLTKQFLSGMIYLCPWCTQVVPLKNVRDRISSVLISR